MVLDSFAVDTGSLLVYSQRQQKPVKDQNPSRQQCPMTSAYIALGSNLKAPEQQLRLAASALDRLPGSHIERCSSIYRSAPVGPGEQPDYLNAVIRLATTLSPIELLATLQRMSCQDLAALLRSLCRQKSQTQAWLI